MSEFKINVGGDVGSIGDNSSGNVYNFADVVEKGTLPKQLDELSKKLLTEADTEERRSEAKAIENAAREAENKDERKMMNALKGAGKWALQTATQIGATIAAEFIKKGIGM